MIESLSLRLANHIKSVVPEHPASVAKLKFSLAIGINMSFIIALTLLISVVTDRTKEVIIIMLAFAILRQMTGGFHLKTGMGCVYASTILMTVLSYISFDYIWTIGATVISMLLILLLAPAGIEKQSRIPQTYYPVLKWSSFVLVGVNLLVASPLIAIAVFAQSLTLVVGRR
ncbi:accessory gene regulator ArgB-like protein [Paenibacillus sp. FSL K6-1230]|uniref:accessory gene regulator ArgB-like protein n=1 Tax=Paenibacillus sp. FSL K6-1230 TaxID=2921603 RepID=UPI0030FAF244